MGIFEHFRLPEPAGPCGCGGTLFRDRAGVVYCTLCPRRSDAAPIIDHDPGDETPPPALSACPKCGGPLLGQAAGGARYCPACGDLFRRITADELLGLAGLRDG